MTRYLPPPTAGPECDTTQAVRESAWDEGWEARAAWARSGYTNASQPRNPYSDDAPWDCPRCKTHHRHGPHDGRCDCGCRKDGER